MTTSSPFLVEGTFILQAVYAAGARDDGSRPRKYRGRLVDCVRAYAATLRSQPAGVGIDCWKLGTNGAFEKYPEPLRDGEAWPAPPLNLGPIGEVEDLGPVEPLG